MVVLRLGLIVGALAFLWVGYASWRAGYPPEVAVVRGVIGFGAVAIVAYAGEMVVATAPRAEEAAAAAETPADTQAEAPAAMAPAEAPVAAAAAVPSETQEIGAGAPVGALAAGQPIVAPDFGANAGAAVSAPEPAELRPAA